MLEKLSLSTLENILNTLPVEMSFIDKNNQVRYFNKNGDRIFPRPRSIIGRNVRQCHPPKSLVKVTRIIKDFKSGARDNAEFWIDLKDKKIYIRYFAVRDTQGVYLGTLEVSQDITDIKNISGEKRLLKE
jgi:PAS domain S-box-containing protein